MDVYLKIRVFRHRFICALSTDAKARAGATKLVGIQNEELLLHGEMFVDSLIEEIFFWILVAFARI